MADKPEMKQIARSEYACTLCPHFQVKIEGKRNPNQLKIYLDKRLAQHVRHFHADEGLSQAAGQTM
jgi:hypothetical protein